MKIFLKIPLVLLILALGMGWTLACWIVLMIAMFDAFLPVLTSLMLLLAWCGGIALLAAWLFRKKKVAWIGAAMIAAAIASEGSIVLWHWWTQWRHERHSENLRRWEYYPFREDNKLVTPTLPVPERLAGTLPRLNGAYALYPIYAAVVQALYPKSVEFEVWKFLNSTGSDRTFEFLNEGDADLIFGGAPSAKQLEKAKAKGIHYEMIPFGREAFVFFVNKDNPVSNLTSEQIRGIYSGKITNWNELGDSESGEIIAFQRNEGSGSQTMLERIMGATPLVEASTEYVSDGMGDILLRVAEYRNRRTALGFSFRFYTQGMMYNENLKILSVDGVAPTKENIRNGTYPFVTDFYMVSTGEVSENTRKVIDFVLSPAGQEIVEKTGYVPLSADAGTPSENVKK